MTQTQKPENIPATPGTLRLKGSVSEQMERFFDHRIRSAEAQDIIYREAEDAFRNRLDDASGIHGIWQGEFWGKWIISAVRVCRILPRCGAESVHPPQCAYADRNAGTIRLSRYLSRPDKRFRRRSGKDKTRSRLAVQLELEHLVPQIHPLGSAGSVAAAGRTGNSDGGGKTRTRPIRTLRENGIHLGATGTFAGIPSGSILKPVLILLPGNQRRGIPAVRRRNRRRLVPERRPVSEPDRQCPERETGARMVSRTQRMGKGL